MNSRVHPKYKAKYRVSNWAEYESDLVRRSDITIWLSPEAIAAWKPRRDGKRGGQCKYSGVAIETALTLRLVFHLPLRQTECFLTSVFKMMGVDLDVPDHATHSRRSKYLDVELHRTKASEPIYLIVDSTGLSIEGDDRAQRAEQNDQAGSTGFLFDRGLRSLGWGTCVSAWIHAPTPHSVDLREHAPATSELVLLEEVDHSFSGKGTSLLVDTVVVWILGVR